MSKLSRKDKQNVYKMVTIVSDYKQFLVELDEHINNSGYKVSYLANELGISRNAFWKKRKSGKWTITEAEKLVRILALS